MENADTTLNLFYKLETETFDCPHNRQINKRERAKYWQHKAKFIPEFFMSVDCPFIELY